jgi:G3E family GTPase
MDIIQIAGFLGCGKTTLLLTIASILSEDHGQKVAMVVNELGEVVVDGKILEQSGIKVKEISGGCICCQVASSFAATLSFLASEFKPDLVLVEPTGVAIPSQVKDVVRMFGTSKVEAGPAMVLFDSSRSEELLDDERMGVLVKIQLKGADFVIISKADMVDQAQLEECKEAIIKEIPQLKKVRFIEVSVVNRTGVNEVIDVILHR